MKMVDKKKRKKTIDSKDFEGYFPFLIILLVGLVRLLTSKKKKVEPQRKSAAAPSLTIPKVSKKVPPPLPRFQAEIEPKESYHALKVKRDANFWRKKKRSRIQALVSDVGDKRKLILLSEILKNPDHF